MGLTLQNPMQYCSLQHRILLSPPDTFTAECHFCIGPATSFFLELLVIALPSSPVAYWTPYYLWGLYSGIIYFCVFIHGVLTVRILEWVAISFSTGSSFVTTLHMTCPSWVALHGMAHSFTKLHMPLHRDKAVIHEGASFLCRH